MISLAPLQNGPVPPFIFRRQRAVCDGWRLSHRRRRAKEYDSLQAALGDFHIVGEVAPTWVPERFELQSVVADIKYHGFLIREVYASSDGGSLSLTIQNYDSAMQSQIEKDVEGTTIYESGGVEHYLVSDKSFEKAVWINGQLECRIIGNVTCQELKEMIDSIY